MKKAVHTNLTRRERQVMDIMYRSGSAHAGEIMEQLPGKPSYSAVRAILRVLEGKGHVRHIEKDLRYVYLPTTSRASVRESALRHLIDTFFEGSRGKVLATMIGDETTRFSPEELEELESLIKKAKKGARP